MSQGVKKFRSLYCSVSDLFDAFFVSEQDMSQPQRIKVADVDEFPYGFMTPERCMLAALLERARLDLRQAQRDIRESAQAWIFSDDETEFSFLWILERLNLPPGSATRIRKMAKTEVEVGRSLDTRGILSHRMYIVIATMQNVIRDGQFYDKQPSKRRGRRTRVRQLLKGYWIYGPA